jgi:hypothetical protein
MGLSPKPACKGPASAGTLAFIAIGLGYANPFREMV